MEEYKKMWKNFAVFDGRSTRKDYWMAVLFNFVISLIISIISGMIKLPVIGILYGVAAIIPSLAMLFRRFHDTNRSGVWILITLVPLVGWIIELIILCQPSVDEGNKYGDVVE